MRFLLDGGGRLSQVKPVRDPCRQACVAGDLDTLTAGLACDRPRLPAWPELTDFWAVE